MVYGLHTIEDRKAMWQKPEQLEPLIQIPWLVMGDFNAILKGEDRLHGNQVMDVETRDFDQCLLNTELTEMRSIGRYFTWTNSHDLSKIDRELVSAKWLTTWPQLVVTVMDPQFSDHALLCVDMECYQNQIARPFKFMNHLVKHAKFLNCVREVWQEQAWGSLMEKIWYKLKHMKGVMKKLNQKEFSNVEQRLQSVRHQLSEVQKQLRTKYNDPALYDKEKMHKVEVEKWSLVEESILRQKTRVQWLGLGDSNSAYIFASVKSRISQNCIKNDAHGSVLQDNNDIEQEIIGFYKGLLGSCAAELPSINPDIMNFGPILNRAQQLALIKPMERK
ncbi:uncharacterized protein LOC132062291 [Lycium ferocissimum]|uniref:uncharacterized protein LOC132062291 n=1 Tax=Lycium ferocissimum TaxID=112874 RepID=UPI002815338A|nr:uncharacterized protein LOC132062291 [Lycium ferocissimum]